MFAIAAHADEREAHVREVQQFARLMAELADVTVAPPLPNPPRVRWDHADSGVWPVTAGTVWSSGWTAVSAHARWCSTLPSSAVTWRCAPGGAVRGVVALG
jgi:hypothetical protein